MDVSATGAAAAAASAQGAITGDIDASVGHAAPVSVPSDAPAPQTHSSSHSDDNHSAIAPAVAKLFNVPGPQAPTSLNVSYRVISDTHQIITVFTDPKTGQEVASFPPEILVNLAQFFDQPHGATFDRSA
jgi:uncharacterized FlaG/YvyC family protein